MPVGFGFSVGDFISALELVSTIIDALRDSGEVSMEYRELLRQLYALETALLRVKRLDVDETQASEVFALRQVAVQCQGTIDDFWTRIQDYEPSLRKPGSSRLKDKWLKVKWSICHKDDIGKFQADLRGHTEAIMLLLNTIQMDNITISNQMQASLSGRIQNHYVQVMSKLGSMCTNITVGLKQGQQLLEITTNVVRTNMRIFQAIMQVQDIVTRIPGQIERQQPIFLVDALGKFSPFYLEFIRSAEAFKSVLKANFKPVGATGKIERNEFVLEDAATRMNIDLSNEWEACFSPGQHVNMSMMFDTTSKTSTSICPSCGENNAGEANIDCTW